MSLAGWTFAELATLFAAFGGGVTMLYLLRMRRRQVVVPFAALWERVTRESETRRLWRKLRRLWSWVIQMALLALICFALGDPRPDVWLRDPMTLAIVIDRSASMAGPAESGKRRVDDALERARAEVRALGPADRALVIAAGAEVSIVSPLGRDPGKLLSALHDLEPRPGEADITRALALAHHAVSDHPGPRILLLSDGALDVGSLGAVDDCIQGPTTCHVVRIDGPDDNVAITAFAARRYPRDREHVEVLAEIQNLGDEEATFVIDIQAEGVSLANRPITLGPGQSKREVLSGVDAARSRLVATLQAAPGGGLVGPTHDDVAYAVVPPMHPVEVALVTDGTDLFLEAALLTLDDHVRLSGVAPDDARAGDPALAEADIVFFDVGDDALPEPLPSAHIVIFDPWRQETSPSPIALKKRVRRPFLTEQARKHPLLEHVVLKDVNLGRGTTFETVPGDQVLVRTLGEPIMVLREREHGFVAIGFDPRQSDLPLRIAFPVLVDNLVTYFEQREAGFVASLPIGANRELNLSELGLSPDGVTRVEVTGPEGVEPARLAVQNGRFRMRALEPGFHRIRTLDGVVADAEVEVAINQASLAASDLHDRLDDVPDSDADAPAPATPIGEGPIWTLILLAAAVLIALEWATYHRRITV